MSPLDIVRIPVLSDNYVWLVHDPDSKATMVVDPAVAEPVLEAAAARGWTITDIWNTHWHPDHTGGNAAIKAAAEAWGGCIITGPAAEAEKIGTSGRRTLPSSAGSIAMVSFSASATQPIISEAGNGQGCEAR